MAQRTTVYSAAGPGMHTGISRIVCRHALRWTGGLATALVLLATVLRGEEPEKPATLDLAALDGKIVDTDRQHWAFQAVVRPPVPKVKNHDWVRNPIDQFVLAQLEKKGWQPAVVAKPQALLRRVYLDLLGLPPTLKEQEQFLTKPTAEQLDQLLPQLLDRPGYGERWGRHWLDLVRYAETNGYERDAVKPHVWRYRDYVIRSFNEDRPYNRFVLEQLAGDELDDADTETVLATGYYRLGPWDDEPANPEEDRFDQLDDIINTTSQVFLGMTLACARCHDHKFEPLTAHDYYRMVAIFDPLKRPQNGRTDLDRPAGNKSQLAQLARRDRQIATHNNRITEIRQVVQDKWLAGDQSKLPGNALAAFTIAADKRTDEQKKLVKEHQASLEQEVRAAFDEKSKEQIAAAQATIAGLRQKTPDLPKGYFFEELSSQSPQTHLLIRGRPNNRGPQVQPGLPTVLEKQQPSFLPANDQTTRRRLTLARWIARKNNPLTARVYVNRVWQHHFGNGLVRTPHDFGVMGMAPTHPQLLDWLASWFVNEANWSTKKLHRLIMSSNTYRMSREKNPDYATIDPENMLLWRNSYQRLEVEAIRDSMLAVSGQLNRKMYGPSTYPFVPRAAMEGHSDPNKIWKPFDEREASRRTVYAHIKRSLVVPFLEVLDLCDTTQTTPQRLVTSVAPQALTLFNGDFVNRQARHFANRLVREAGADPAKQINLAYRLALCRLPTVGEQKTLFAFLQHETEQFQRTDNTGKIDATKARQHALQQVCRVILNLNEFCYPD